MHAFSIGFIANIIALIASGSTLANASEPSLTVSAAIASKAKSVGVFQLELTESGEVAELSLEIGETPTEFKLVEHGGSGKKPLLYGVLESESATKIIVPIVANFERNTAAFLFPARGTYYLRWTAVVKGTRQPIQTVQMVEVTDPNPSDLRFFAEFDDPSLVEEFSRDFRIRPMPIEAEKRAIVFIRELLRATTDREPFEGKFEDEASLLRWGERAIAFAREYPDSTFSPYLAFFPDQPT